MTDIAQGHVVYFGIVARRRRGWSVLSVQEQETMRSVAAGFEPDRYSESPSVAFAMTEA